MSDFFANALWVKQMKINQIITKPILVHIQPKRAIEISL